MRMAKKAKSKKPGKVPRSTLEAEAITAGSAAGGGDI
jgi:hypothetical protein